MTESAELLFKIQTQGLDALDRAAGTVKNVSLETKYGATNLASFEKALGACRGAGESYRRSLELIAKSGNELDKVTQQIARDLLDQAKAYDKASKEAEKAAKEQAKAAATAEKESRASFESFAAGVRNGITNPFNTAGTAVEGMLLKLGPTGAIATGAAVGLGIAAKAAFDLSAATGALAEEHLNLSERTGLSVKEVGTFSGAAQLAGVNIGAIVSSMRTFSQALSENSLEGKKGKAALQELGIEALDQQGHLRPMGELWLDIADAISKVESPTERARLAMALFGRGGLELMPLLRGNFRELTKEMEALGVAFTEEGAEKAAAYDDALGKLDLRWQALKRSFGEKIIGVIEIVAPEVLGGERNKGEKTDFFYNARTGKYEYRSKEEQQRGKEISNQVQNLLRPQQTEFERMLDLGKGGALLSDLQKSYSGSESGQQARLTELNAEIDKLRGALLARDGKGLASEVGPEIEKLKGFEAERDAIQKRIAGSKEYEQVVKQVQALLEQAQLSELTGLQKIQREREKLLATLGKDAGLRAQINQAKDIEVRAELKRLDEVERKAKAGARTQLEETEKQSNAARVKASEEAGQRFTEALKKQIAEGEKELASMNRILDIIRNGDRAELQAQSAHVQRISQLLSGPGDEARAIEDAYRQRLSLAEQLYEQERSRWEAEADANKREELHVSAMIARDKERHAAEREHELQVLELRKKREDLARAEASEFYQALKAGDTGGFFRNKFDKLGEQVFVNATASQFEQMGTQLAGMIPGQFDGEGNRTGIGKLLAGTFLDSGRNQTPVDKNTTATELNTKATEKLEKTLRTGAAGAAGAPAAGELVPGLTGVTFGDLLTFGSDVNGITGTGGIARGIPGLGRTSSTLDRVFSGLTSPLAGAGLFAGFNGSERSIRLPDGSATTASAMGLTSTAGRVANIAGSTAMVGAGAMGIYSGIREGGARGYTNAISSGLGVAAAIPGPQQPFLMAGAAIAGFVSSFFPDPKAERERDINEFLQKQKYQEPNAINRVTDLAGNAIHYDFEGRIRSSAPAPITVHIQAFDAQSFLDRSHDLADAVAQAMGDGHKIANVVQRTVRPV